MGVKTPAGATVDDAWSAVLAGQSLARRLDVLCDAPVTFGCPVVDFEPRAYFAERVLRRMDRPTMLGLAAARDAVEDAKLELDDVPGCGVFVGTGAGGLFGIVEMVRTLQDAELDIPAHAVPTFMPSSAAAQISLALAVCGPSLTFATACASGATAIGEAASKIRSGSCDVAVAGGVDAVLHPLVLTAFWRLGALSERTDDPERASRPFDESRDGFVMGEGAAFVVLEEWEAAVRRGARIYGEVAGYGSTCDAFHVVAPGPGDVARRCMELALADAGVDPADVTHVNAHGTSTVLNDRTEAVVIRSVVPEGTPVTATKGVTGHMIGAAGAFEAIITLLSGRENLVPPVANHVVGEGVVDVVQGAARRIGTGPAISNSFGFGGLNASLVLVPSVV
ncbi:beta-ketoacyl-[acyl-carrier-protein] synthase family protein [Blastococcus sp. TF02-8]|nr:beta-ketoacyl-[acyl-carrier-protein] synthase family protein [Blastococcus sp. TF02-8]